MITPTIFRAYDIRGIVDTELNSQTMQKIGWALGTQAQQQKITHIALGRDGRLSSPKLSQAFAQGVINAGVNILDFGCIPTPTLYYAAEHHTSASGAMITGSHNPANYNGVKMLLNKKSLANEDITSLQKCIEQNLFYHATKPGSIIKQNIEEAYLTEITTTIKLSKPLKIVIDCGNGVTGPLATQLYKKLGANVIELYTQIDGNFPNHHPDPSAVENLKELQQVVLHNHADVGFAFDGDGDRLGVISNTGEIIWPDRLLMLFAEKILSQSPNETILYDVKCTRHLESLIKKHNGIPQMCQTGHSLIKKQMHKTKAALAGEMSGHFFFKHRWYGFDDALYAGARLLEIISNTSTTLSAIMEQYPDSVNTPEIKIAMPDHQKTDFIASLIKQAKFTSNKYITLDGLRVEFPYGWGLIRASNTSPYLILRFEAENQQQLKQIIKEFTHNISQIDPAINFPSNMLN